jgi:predicted transcriptional regulator
MFNRMSGTQTNSQRKRPMITLTLSPDAVERLDEIAKRTGRTRSATVEGMVRAAEMPRPKAT